MRSKYECGITSILSQSTVGQSKVLELQQNLLQTKSRVDLFSSELKAKDNVIESQRTMTVMSVSSGGGSPGHFPSTSLQEVDEIEDSDSGRSQSSQKMEQSQEESCSRRIELENRYASTAL